MKLRKAGVTSHLCAVDLVVGKVSRVFEFTVWAAYQQLPTLLSSFIQQRPRAEVQFPHLRLWQALLMRAICGRTGAD